MISLLNILYPFSPERNEFHSFSLVYLYEGILHEAYKESRVDAFKRVEKKYNISQEDFDKVVEADPTSTKEILGRHSDWLLKQYYLNNLGIDDLKQAMTNLDIFDRYREEMEIKDLNAIKSPTNLSRMVEPFIGKVSKGQRLRKIAEGQKETDFIFENERWFVIRPKTKDANIYWARFGCGIEKAPKWCTSAESAGNMFLNYTNEGDDIYMIINKEDNEEKYQYVEKDHSLWDKTNTKTVDNISGMLVWLEERKITSNELYDSIKNPTIKGFKKAYPDMTDEEIKKYIKRGYRVKYAKGNKEWYLNGELHREDGPAAEGANGDKYWYLNGELHREDGPAVERANGSKEWYLDGECHRVDGPAIEYANGDKEWYLKGNLHRVDGPAVEYANGEKVWYINGKFHRVDGPAIEWANGDKEWYINNEIIARQNKGEGDSTIYNQEIWDKYFK